MTPDEIVAAPGGTARRDQLRGRVGRGALRDAVAAGRLEALGHGRYGLPTTSETHRRQVLLSGTIACLSAAVEHGLPVLRPPDRPWIAVPPTRRVDVRRRRGVHLMWVDVDGTVTSPLRTVLDCLVRLPAVESLAVADSALRLGVVEADELVHAAAGLRGPGSPAARRLAREATPLAMSPLESALRALLLDLPGLDLRPQVALRVGEVEVHPDLYDERLGIVVEAEGWLYHGNPEQFARDLQRYTTMASPRSRSSASGTTTSRASPTGCAPAWTVRGGQERCAGAALGAPEPGDLSCRPCTRGRRPGVGADIVGRLRQPTAVTGGPRMSESDAEKPTLTEEAPPRWKVVGPGLVVAATGVGAADLVATAVAGARYGYALLWVAVLGAVIKVVLVEGAGRYSLATGRTIFEGWRSLGKWTTFYFAPYIMVWGFVYGATAMSSSALPVVALFPSLNLTAVAIVTGLLGLAMVWFGTYAGFEKIMAALIGIMFFAVLGAAILTLPNLGEVLTGLVPTLPDGSIVYALTVMGGVGGTITLAAYGYWLREKGWSTPRFMRIMRLDNGAAYAMTGVFVVAMLVVGAELLFSAGIAIDTGDQGLVQIGDVLTERYGEVYGVVFLVGFFAASFSSLIGVWSGVSLMFADFVGNVLGLRSGHPDTRTGGKYFRYYLLWLTFPPMLLLLLGRPVGLILAYGVLGAFFMPFLAVTLLLLLNRKGAGRVDERALNEPDPEVAAEVAAHVGSTDGATTAVTSGVVPEQWRNGWLSNSLMTLCAVLFAGLMINELVKAVTENWPF